jgi:dsRNA-specific ribonuclease
MKYRAYVIADAGIVEKIRNPVVGTEWLANFAMKFGKQGYIVEGERAHKWNWLNRKKGGSTFRTEKEFCSSLIAAIESVPYNLFLTRLQEFVQENGLRVTQFEAAHK